MTSMDTVARAYDAFARGDTAGVVSLLAPTIEWRLAEHHPYNPANTAWTTPEQTVAGLFDRVAADWERFRCTPVRFHDADDHVIVEGRYTARYRPTQRDEDAQFCHVWHVRDGQIVGFVQYVDTAQVREVMGVTTPTIATDAGLFLEPDGIDAAWVHVEARRGFECASLRRHGDGHRLVGHTTASEDGRGWSVGYRIELDNQWRTIAAEVNELIEGQQHRMELTSDRHGHWRLDGADADVVDGCMDIDLESSALTNTIFMHRVQPSTTEVREAPAAYVRCAPLRLDRLEQTYRRSPEYDTFSEVTFDYTSPAFGTYATLRFDRHGLVTDYPGLAIRHR